MKLIIVLLIASLAVVSAQRNGNVSKCTMAGDPHFTTFDGCLHDFQGKGTFEAVRNDILQVHYHAEPCNGGSVTCVKAVFVSFKSPFDDALCVVKMNVYLAAASNNLTINNNYYTWNNLTSVVKCSDDATVTKTSNGYFVVNGVAGWVVEAAQHVLIVTLPRNTNFFLGNGLTRGICGLFDDNPVNDFTAPNGTQLEVCAKSPARTNTARTNAWGALYFVTADRALVDRSYYLENKFSILDAPVVPDNNVQEQLNKVIFNDFQTFTDAKDRCTALSTSKDATEIENCVYDVAVLGDYTLAASNIEAANTANAQPSSSSSGLNGGAIAGIVLGCIAFISLVTAFVLYIRLRKLRTEYSRALIVRSQAQDTNAPASGGLADNL